MKLSNRCTVLRDRIVNEKPLNEKILPQHIMLFEAGIWNALQTGCSRPHSRIAAGMENVILNAPIIIQDLELLVGYNYADTPYPEFWSPTDTEEDKQIVLNAGFTLEQYRAHLQHHDEVLKYWQYDRHSCGYAQNHADITAEGPFDFIRDFTTADLELDDEWAAIGRCMSDNHTIIGYEKVLRKGFLGLLEEVEQAEKQHGPSDFYDALKALCRAAATLGARYAAQARELAKDYEPGSERYDELLRIAAVCDRVPAQPARSFHEAVQSLVFAHIINTWEDGINANSLGRLDQILYPYYVNDITNKKLSDEQAFELICSLWLKLYRDYDVQQSCVGGCDRNGKDATNALSYMMLDATEALGFIRCLSVRYHSGTDKAFLKRALEVVGRVQKGVPFFFNDEVMIPALVSKGIALEDAREYTQIGCVETVLPGMSNPHAVSGETNLLKALEYALADGYSMFDPNMKPGLSTGCRDSFTTYEKLEQAVCVQIENILDVTCKKVYLWMRAAEKANPKPYKSLLSDDCLASGRDFNNHGVKYDFYQIMLGGIPNLADSLQVIKQLVYEDKKYSLEYFYEQLMQDFPNEAFRQECLHKVPKFGNDEDCVDELAAKLIDFSCDVLEKMDEKYEISYHPQPFTFLWMVDQGRVSAASPDGRRRGEITAYSMSPMQGRDFTGFTALLNSLAKMPTKRCPGTTSAIVEVDPHLFTDSNIPLFVEILLVAAAKGLCNVQFNTMDAETMIDAQRHPECHNNLAVRVSGFSQKFNLLDKSLQDHIIGRTKHQCL